MEYKLLQPTFALNNNASLIEKVFANRGFQPSDIEHYLHTTRDDILSPDLIDNIHKGALMLANHLIQGNKIFIQVDSDADGYTSAAALINYLNMRFPGTVQNNISYRLHSGKQHGVILDTIPKDTKLVIIPDAGSNQFIEHEQLAAAGIDVLVIDHHEADYVSSYAVVINNQTCDYPNKDLSGVGMVYKFCQEFDKFFEDNKADEILDLVAIGVVSDMMDLRQFETKELIDIGVNSLRNPFISNFVKAQQFSLKGEVTPFGISFYITPFINATIRIGSPEEKKLLFESMLDFKAYEQIPSTKRGCKGQFETRVEQACRTIKNLKNRQQKLRDTTIDMIEEIIEENNLLKHPVLIIQLFEPVEENLTGLIANQIMGKYGRPVVLLNKYMDIDPATGEVRDFQWRGSGRNATYSKLENFREFCAKSNLVIYAQGHANAFGIAISADMLEAFITYIDTQLKDFDFSNCYRVDCIWSGNEAEQYKDDIITLGSLNHIWGQGIPQPYIAIENIHVNANNLTLMSPDKNPTLKITLPGNLTLIKFKSSAEEFEKLYTEEGCVNINIVGTCNLNEWNGNISPQIFIEDYEIINQTRYYF